MVSHCYKNWKMKISNIFVMNKNIAKIRTVLKSAYCTYHEELKKLVKSEHFFVVKGRFMQNCMPEIYENTVNRIAGVCVLFFAAAAPKPHGKMLRRLAPYQAHPTRLRTLWCRFTPHTGTTCSLKFLMYIIRYVRTLFYFRK